MKKIKWFVIGILVLCSILLLCASGQAVTNEEYTYTVTMADHGNNISLAMSNFSNMLKIVSEKGIDDTVMIAKLITSVASLDTIAGQAKDIPCPSVFKESNKCYLQAMECIHEFCDLFIRALLNDDADEMNEAFDLIPIATKFINQSLNLLESEMDGLF